MFAATWVKFTMSANITGVPQAVGDRAGEDVEQQLFRTLLFDLDLLVGDLQALVHLAVHADGKAQQGKDDYRKGDEIEGEEDDGGARWHDRPRREHRIGEVPVGEAGDSGQDSPGGEPADALAHAYAQDRADRGKHGPDQDAAAGNDVAAPLRDKGQEQEQAELADAEKLEIPRHDVEQHVAGQQKLEGKGHGIGELRPENRVDGHPEDDPDARQSGGEHQQGLVQAQLLAVARFDAGVLQPAPETGRRAD